MGRVSEPGTLVLHTLRIHGLADASRVADDTGLDVEEVRRHLDDMVSTDLAIHREGVRPGHLLTPAGRRAAGEAIARELEEHGLRPLVEETYQAFRELNSELLEVCSAWQMREVDGVMTRNDHADPNHDRAVIQRLTDLDARARPIFTGLTESLARFGRYGPAFAHAVDQLLSGDRDWFTKPLFPSYHTLWFELHEDLLATLGLERSAEVSG